MAFDLVPTFIRCLIQQLQGLFGMGFHQGGGLSQLFEMMRCGLLVEGGRFMQAGAEEGDYQRHTQSNTTQRPHKKRTWKALKMQR